MAKSSISALVSIPLFKTERPLNARPFPDGHFYFPGILNSQAYKFSDVIL